MEGEPLLHRYKYTKHNTTLANEFLNIMETSAAEHASQQKNADMSDTNRTSERKCRKKY